MRWVVRLRLAAICRVRLLRRFFVGWFRWRCGQRNVGIGHLPVLLVGNNRTMSQPGRRDG